MKINDTLGVEGIILGKKMTTETDQRVIKFLKETAKKNPGVVRIIIFGSRARSDARERSDFDIAVETEGSSQEWSKLLYEMKEDIPTLCHIDLIHLNTLKNEELLASIEKEGKVIYERH